MKQYKHYVVMWWDFQNRKSCERHFKLEKCAKKFASQLSEDSNAHDRNFFAYDHEWNKIEEFTF